MERELTTRFGVQEKFSFEERLGVTAKVYSQEFTRAYQRIFANQQERQMRSAIKMVGNFWYTCWVDAGQPDLDLLLELRLDQKELEQQGIEAQKWREAKIKIRPHE